jgi:hypothetical protein
MVADSNLFRKKLQKIIQLNIKCWMGSVLLLFIMCGEGVGGGGMGMLYKLTLHCCISIVKKNTQMERTILIILAFSLYRKLKVEFHLRMFYITSIELFGVSGKGNWLKISKLPL